MFAQNPVPNAGFENWTNDPTWGLIPSGWACPSNNSFAALFPITRSTDSYTGTYAVYGEVLDFAGVPLSPVIYSGTVSQPFFPISENHISFEGNYKFSPEGGDKLLIEVIFINPADPGGAEGHLTLENEVTGTYLGFDIPMVYDPQNPQGWQATQASITITIEPPSGEDPHVGTWFLVDHFTFDGYPLDVKEISNSLLPEEFILEQNYPNPFNPETKINFSLPEESFVTLKIFNIQGEEVAIVVNESLTAGNYSADWNATNLPSGVYYYSLVAGNEIQSRKMILMK